jgi:hypothetical protein
MRLGISRGGLIVMLSSIMFCFVLLGLLGYLYYITYDVMIRNEELKLKAFLIYTSIYSTLVALYVMYEFITIIGGV